LHTVVSDAGPLIHLAQVSKLNLLRRLFGTVVITSKVKEEVVDEGLRLAHADASAIKEAMEEGWIVVEEVPEKLSSAAKRLAEGENLSQSDAETLLLARQRKVEIFLVDEKPLSDLAKMYRLKVWNTWTILLEALSRGFIKTSDIEFAIHELGKRRHKLKPEQATEILEAAKLVLFRRKNQKTINP